MKVKLICLGVLSSLLFAGSDEDKRLEESATVLKEIQGTKDTSIPHDLFAKSVCSVVIPGMKKGGFIVGAKYGKGFASCRKGRGWSAPSAVRIEGGSFGLQIGGSATDVVLLVMNKSGMEHLLKSKFTLGGEATAAAGPAGRDASAMTDATMKAEILSWSRSRGVFAGVSLDGATLRPDEDVNKDLYGKKVEPKEILTGPVTAPPASKEFLALLAKFGAPAKAK